MGNIDLLYHLVKVAGVSTEPLSPWTDRFTRCMTAYIRRDYSACAAAGRESLSHGAISSVGLVTIMSLRRRGQSEEAEDLSRTMLECSFAGNEEFLFFMMLLDGALNPERFLEEKFFCGRQVRVTPELECQVYFYWGGKLLTEGKSNEAIKPLSLSVGSRCSVLERLLADADLQTATTKLLPGNGD